jgi:TonB-linked SusC/RagA family outer membrane protein
MRKILLLLSGVLLLSAQLLAQTRTISGKITDGQASPIPNVSVIVKGTSVGTTTNESGSYTLNVPDKAKTLVISAVGMATQEVSIGSRTDISVTLLPGESSLQEVVVVGYGKTTKEAFTGSAVQVKGEVLNNKSVSNVSQALAGEVAGVRVINTSGQPGTAATIRIRGLGSVNGNRDPLYVVDGVPFTGNINAINMEDVASVSVLKDAAATAIYGARGANGVIIVTTRSGSSKGKGFIEVDGKWSTNKSLIPRYDVIRSPEDYIILSWEALYNQGRIVNNAAPGNYANTRIFSASGISPNYNIWNVTGPNLIDSNTKTIKPGVSRKYDPENWEDHAFQSSNRNEVNLKIGGGDSKSNYYTSFGYLNDVGYSINTDFRRLTARLNVNHEVRKWLVGSMNIAYANVKSNQNGQESNSNSVFWFVDNNPSIYPLFLRDANGNFVNDSIFGGHVYDYGAAGRKFGALTNAIADAHYNTVRDDRHELVGNTALTAKFTNDLSFETRLGFQYFNNNNIERINKFYGSAASTKGSIYHDRTEMFSYNLLKLLRYNKRFGAHNFEALAAHENTDWKNAITQVFKFNLVQNDGEDLANAVEYTEPDAYTDRYKLESYFAQVNYDFRSTYYLTGSFRRDGSSKFVDDKWGNFGSVGAGWIISNENFMADQNIFKFLKLKASYGLIGEQSGIGNYPGYDVFNVDPLNNRPSFSFATKGNPQLTWETSKIFQTGVEFRVKDFLTGTVEYYVKNTDGLIFDRRVGPSSGYALIKSNDGILRNQGIEFNLTGHIIQKKDWFLDLTINGESFKNKIIEMPIDTFGTRKVIDIQGNYGWGKDHSIFDFYMREYAGVDPADGRVLWTAYYDDLNNNDKGDAGEYIVSLTQYMAQNPGKAGSIKKTTSKVYSVNATSRTEGGTQFYVGKSAIPKVRGAVNLNSGYKGLTLAVQVLYSFGGYAYDGAYASLMNNGLVGGNNWHTDMFGRWQKAGDVTDIPRLSNQVTSDANFGSASSRWITKANYLVLNNIRLGYNLPKSILSRVKVDDAAIWVSGDNLWLNSERKGFNPSTAESGASSVYRYSPLSTMTVGMRVKF